MKQSQFYQIVRRSIVSMLDSKIQCIAEDCAYTFKGLYKQSDIKEKYINHLILCPLGYSIVLLVFPEISTQIIGKIFAIITLIFSILLLVGNKSSENIVQYRKIANSYKALYDELYLLFQNPNTTENDLEKIINEKRELNDMTSQYPIGFIARLLSRLVIKKEMNIQWLKDCT